MLRLKAMISYVANPPKEGLKSSPWNQATSIVFMLQIQLVVGISIFFSAEAISGIDAMVDDSFEIGRSSFWRLLIISLLCSIVSCMGFLVFIINYSRKMVPFSFFAAPTAMACVALVTGYCNRDRSIWESFYIFRATAEAFMVTVIAYWLCQDRSTGASATLHGALTAVWANSSLHYYQSIVLIVLNNAWIVAWTIGAFGVHCWAREQRLLVPCQEMSIRDAFRYANVSSTADNVILHDSLCEKDYSLPPAVYMLLGASLYWTQQTFKGVIHATTAYSMGNWWKGSSRPDDARHHVIGSSLSSSAAAATAFGSLCHMAFTLPLLQVLRRMVHTYDYAQAMIDRKPTNNKEDFENLLLSYLRGVVSELGSSSPSWSFVTIGYYEQEEDYVSAERKVTELFLSRRWTHLLEERTVYRILWLCHFAIAVTSGCLAWCATLVEQEIMMTSNREEPEWSNKSAFLAGFLWGLIMGSSILTFIEGAVRTIIVCFAETYPEDDFKRTRLAFEMKRGLEQVYPCMRGTRE
jgi:hypothetical protein